DQRVSTQDMYNFLQVDENTLTAGQPTEEQLRAAAADGVQVVINLATFEPGRSLPDEGDLVQALGMAYHHIPVVWERPTQEDFDAFVAAMGQTAGQRVLIHCMANYRVTAFYSLYGMQRLGWSEAQADALRAEIWKRHYPVWEQFIQGIKSQIKANLP